MSNTNERPRGPTFTCVELVDRPPVLFNNIEKASDFVMAKAPLVLRVHSMPISTPMTGELTDIDSFDPTEATDEDSSTDQ